MARHRTAQQQDGREFEAAVLNSNAMIMSAQIGAQAAEKGAKIQADGARRAAIISGVFAVVAVACGTFGTPVATALPDFIRREVVPTPLPAPSLGESPAPARGERSAGLRDVLGLAEQERDAQVRRAERALARDCQALPTRAERAGCEDDKALATREINAARYQYDQAMKAVRYILASEPDLRQGTVSVVD